MIVLVRADDRLIHGQCMTVIVKEWDIKEIIVVDDFTATNPILKKVFASAVPPDMKADAYTVADATAKIKDSIVNDVRTMVLMKKPSTYLQLLENVPDIPKEMMVGAQTKGKDTVSVTSSIYLTADEGAKVKKCVEMGAHVYFQQVPSQPKVEWDEVKDKF